MQQQSRPVHYYSLVWTLLSAQCRSSSSARVIVCCDEGFKSIFQATIVSVALCVAGKYKDMLQSKPQQASASASVQSQGCRPPLVAVLLPRSLEYVVAVLAALAAGAAFLPLDASWPLARLQQALQDAQPDLLMHSSSTRATAAAAGRMTGCLVLLLDKLLPNWRVKLETPHDSNDVLQGGLVCNGCLQTVPSQQQQQHTEQQWQQLLQDQQLLHQPEQCGQQSEQLQPLPWFYVLYTSGSAGKPCGVLGTEQGFINRFQWMQLQQKQLQQQQWGSPQAAPARGVIDKQQLQAHHSPHVGTPQQQRQQQHSDDRQQQQQQQQVPQQQQQKQCMPVALHPGHVVAFKTATGFVDHIWELLAPFLAGSDMLLITEPTTPVTKLSQWVQHSLQPTPAAAHPSTAVSPVLQPDRYVQLLAAHRVTHLAVVPSVLQLLLPALSACKQHLSLLQLVTSGEMLPVTLAKQTLAALPDRCVLLNLYGFTEASADVTCQLVTSQLLNTCGTWVPAGKPINNMMVVVGTTSSLIEHSNLLPNQVVEQHRTASETSSAAQQAPGPMMSAAAAAALADSKRADVAQTAAPVSAAALANALNYPAPLMPLPAGVEGEVWVSGPGLAAGYLPPAHTDTTGETAAHGANLKFKWLMLTYTRVKAEAEAAQAVSVAIGPGMDWDSAVSKPQTWFRTGDLGSMDENGVLWLRGRCDHQIKVKGVRVDLLEVERVLSQHHMVDQVALKAWPHPVRQQDSQLVIYVVLHCNNSSIQATAAPASATEAAAQPSAKAVQQADQQQQQRWQPPSDWRQQLQQFAAAKLPAAARPSSYILLSQLPRSTAGKVLRSQLPPPHTAVSTSKITQKQCAASSAAVASVAVVANAAEAAAAATENGRDSEGLSISSAQQAKPLLPEVMVMHAMLKALHGSLAAANHTAITAAAHGPGATRFEPTDDFFSAGGDSLAAATAAAELGIDIRLVYAYTTARSLAACLQCQGNKAVQTYPTDLADGTNRQQQRSGKGGPSAGQNKAMPITPITGQQQPAKGQPLAAGAAALIQPPIKRRRLTPAATSATATKHAAGVTNQHPVPAAGDRTLLHAHPEPLRISAAARFAVTCGAAGRWQVRQLVTPGATIRQESQELLLQRQQREQDHGQYQLGLQQQEQQQLEGQNERAQRQQQQAQGVANQSIASAEEPTGLELHWRLPLGRCVDAAPLLLALVGTAAAATGAAPGSAVEASSSTVCARGQQKAASGQQQSYQQANPPPELLELVAFACSHDGTVASIDVPSGKPYWRQTLPSRADAGMCLSPCARYLAVACGDARVYCLAVEDGRVEGFVECGGEIRAAPVSDLWEGHWWVVTHAKELLVLKPPPANKVISRLSLPAAGSASISFAAAAGLALVGLLDGTLLAVTAATVGQASASMDGRCSNCNQTAVTDGLNNWPVALHAAAQGTQTSSVQQTQQQRQQEQHGPNRHLQQALQVGAVNSKQLSVIWSCRLSAPIFSSPVVPEAAGLVVAATVDGTVCGLSLATGAAIWQCKVPGQIFADLLLLPQHWQPASAAATTAIASAGSRQAEGAGAGVSVHSVSTNGQEVLVATQPGWVYGCDLSTGAQDWGLQLSNSSISAAPTTVVPLTVLLAQCTATAEGQTAAAAAGSNAILAGQGSTWFHPLHASGQTTFAAEHAASLHNQKQQGTSSSHLLVGSSNGNIDVLQQSGTAAAVAQPSSLLGVQLPGEVFSSPVAADGWVVVGCRDDHLYCLRQVHNRRAVSEAVVAD